MGHRKLDVDADRLGHGDGRRHRERPAGAGGRRTRHVGHGGGSKVAGGMVTRLVDLPSVVQFGPLPGFLLLHASVIALFWVKMRSGRWVVHVVVPVAGIAVVLAVLTGMSSVAMILGLSWLGIGLVYGAMLRKRHRTDLTL